MKIMTIALFIVPGLYLQFSRLWVFWPRGNVWDFGDNHRLYGAILLGIGLVIWGIFLIPEESS